MKTKYFILYGLGLLIVGIFLGRLIFYRQNKVENQSSTVKEKLEAQVWTCSMHPQIRQPDPGDCPICGMDLILSEPQNKNSNLLSFKMTEDAIRIANIQTTKIGALSAQSNGLKLSGKIKANETKSASIVSHVPGRIEKLYISFTGERIQLGQKIASVYSPKLISTQKELLEAYKVRTTNPKLYEATLNKMKYWGITSNQIQDIITSNQIIRTFDIYSDFSGVVLNKRVMVGDYLNEGQVLFDIQSLDQLWAVFDVYESDLQRVNIGDKIRFETSSSPGKIFTSTITFIDPVINRSTRTAKIRSNISNSRNLLKPEMFIEGTINKGSRRSEAILVPKTAVLWTGERSVVYVKQPTTEIPTFEYREITLGQSLGQNYIVLEGLKMKEEVVTNGAFVIDASAQLNNQYSMMNRKLLKHQRAQDNELIIEFSNTTSPRFKKQLQQVLRNYLNLKNSLVTGRKNEAIDHAGKVQASLSNVESTLLDETSRQYWLRHHLKLENDIKRALSSKDLEELRKNFSPLSNRIILITKSYGVYSDTFFVQYCPMAANDQGAFWLSNEEDIRNPYYGDEMLTCGTVKDTIDKNYRINQTKSLNKRPVSGHQH